MNIYAVAFNPSGDDLVEVHALGCQHLRRQRLGQYSAVIKFEAPHPQVALDANLDDEFGSVDEVCCGPRQGQSVDDASFREAGHTGRIFNCARRS